MIPILPSRVSPAGVGAENDPEHNPTPGDMTRRPVADSTNPTGQLLAHASTTELIFALQVFSREQNKMQSETTILGKKDQVDNALRDEHEAIAKRQAEENDKSKWLGIKGKLSTISTVALIAASAASVVASGGVSAPLAVALVGMAISLAAKPVGQAVGSKGLEIGMQYGGMALSLAGGFGSLGSGAKAASTAVSAGTNAGAMMSVTTASTTAAASSASSATSTLASVAGVIHKAASITGGAVKMGEGVATYEVGHHDSLARDAQADATEAGALKRKHTREMDDLIELLKEAEKSFSKAKSALRSASDSHAASNLTLVTMGVRA